jgi:dTMP kinase
MPVSPTGLFITIEGGEATGKSTLASALPAYILNPEQNWLSKWVKRDVLVTTREPGGSPAAEKIRDLVKNGFPSVDPIALCMMMNAARMDHIQKIIKPALDQGGVVICDRFTDSTLAYQGYGQGADKKIIHRLNQIATGGLEPDITILLDADPKVTMPRTISRAHTDGKQIDDDLFDAATLEFHQRVRDGFIDIARKAFHRVYPIRSDKLSADLVFKSAVDVIKRGLGRKTKTFGHLFPSPRS